MTRLLCVLLAVAGFPVDVAAQVADPCKTLTVACVKADIVRKALKTIDVVPKESLRQPFGGTVDEGASLGPLVTAVLLKQVQEKQAYKALVDLMAVRVDTQVGATSQSSGGTSLATKGTIPAILGLAVEHGALTRDVNGTVVTFRASPSGLVKALQGKGLLDIYRDYDADPWNRFASRFSLAASFDTSRGDAPKTLLANEQQLSAWSIDVVLYNERDPRSSEYKALWAALPAGDNEALNRTREQVVGALVNWSQFGAWHKAFKSRIQTEVDGPWEAGGKTREATERAEAAMVRILDEEIPTLAALGLPPGDVQHELDAYVASLTNAVKYRNNVYEYALKGTIATFDWTTTRDPNLPDLYSVTGVYETSFGAKRLTDFTANAALNFYREKVAGRQLKDYGVTAQLDKPLGSVAEIPFVLTASFKWQYIPKDVPVPASALITSVTGDVSATPAPLPAAGPSGSAIAPKGHLVLGQAKLTIPLKSGVKMPLSVTLANRTELITEKRVIARANFGITFDLDAFTAAIKAR